MHNIERRVGYAAQRYGIGTDQARAMVMAHIAAGTEDTLLTPAQRRRVSSNALSDGGRLARRRAENALLSARRRLWMWDVLTPRPGRVVLPDQVLEPGERVLYLTSREVPQLEKALDSGPEVVPPLKEVLERAGKRGKGLLATRRKAG